MAININTSKSARALTSETIRGAVTGLAFSQLPVDRGPFQTPGADVIVPPRDLPPRDLPPAPPPPPAPPAATGGPKATTELARGAIGQLSRVGPERVTQAINAIASAGVLDGPGIMTQLERKTRIRLVLDGFAQQWDPTTRADFADAFRMPVDQTDAMDAVVSLAILNDRDLQDEIIAENAGDTTAGDLTDNRRVVWQYPPAGTVLQPPYVMLVAVEYRDVASAADIYKSISDQLGNYTKGTLVLRVPKDVMQRLG